MSKNLTINQITKNIQLKTGQKLEVVEEITKTFIDELSMSLINGRNIRIDKLGTLGVKKRKGRPIKIPKTEITIDVPDKNVVYFIPYDNIKTNLNNYK